MYTAIDYLTKEKDWHISSDPRTYSQYPENYGYRNFIENGIRHDADSNGYHRAMDLYNNNTDNVPSVTHGTVVRATKKGAFGGEVVVEDYNGYYWVYGHLQRDSIKLKKGDKIRQGDLIGLQGNSNYYDNPMNKHLHIQLLAPNANITVGKWYIEGLQIDRYNIKNGDYSPVKGNDTVVKTHLIVAGHGGIDPGAIGNGTNERDFIRNHIVDRVAKYINATPGHKAVVYNKKNNMFVDTQYGAGYGMYWAKSQGYETVTEYHLDAASASARGGHVIVYNGYAPDKIDLGIRDAIKKYVGIRYTHKGHAGISGRNNLLQVNVSANIGVNYRLVELGFITNAADFRAINNNIEALTRDMANAITGGTSSAQSSDNKKPATPKPKPNVTTDKKDPSSKTPRTIGSWQTNKVNGAQYIKAEGTFTVTANDGIISRFHEPSTNAKHGGLAKKGWSTKYDYLVRANGYVWIQYRVNGKGPWKFIPFNSWNSRTGAVGKTAWGTFS